MKNGKLGVTLKIQVVPLNPPNGQFFLHILKQCSWQGRYAFSIWTRVNQRSEAEYQGIPRMPKLDLVMIIVNGFYYSVPFTNNDWLTII